MSLSVSPAFTNFLSPLNYLFATFVWLWLPQYEGKLGLDLLLFRLSHTQVWTLQGHYTFLCREHQRNRETPPTSAAHQYLLIQKSTLWEWTPGSYSSSGWLLIMNDSPRVKDVLMDTFCFATLFLTVPTSLGHGDDWCNKPKMWLSKLEDWSPVIIIKEKYTMLRSFLIDFFS